MQVVISEHHTEAIVKLSKIREVDQYYHQTSASFDSEIQRLEANREELSRITYAVYNSKQVDKGMSPADVALLNKLAKESAKIAKEIEEINAVESAIYETYCDKSYELYDSRTKLLFIAAVASLPFFIFMAVIMAAMGVASLTETLAGSAFPMVITGLMLGFAGASASLKHPKY